MPRFNITPPVVSQNSDGYRNLEASSRHDSHHSGCSEFLTVIDKTDGYAMHYFTQVERNRLPQKEADIVARDTYPKRAGDRFIYPSVFLAPAPKNRLTLFL